MREIKFRGLTPEFSSPRWVYGDLICDCTDEPRIMTEYHDYDEPVTWVVDPTTVGQFTGLLDSNGKEIYEGDILRFATPLRWEDNERRVGVVVFKYFAFVVKYDDTSTGLFNLAVNDAPYTIIGNVIDSPELLEADHERD